MKTSCAFHSTQGGARLPGRSFRAKTGHSVRAVNSMRTRGGQRTARPTMWFFGLIIALLAALPCLVRAQDASSAFDAANKLYEQGKFRYAAEAYEKVLPESFASAALYFNEGNAWFKSA